MKNQNSLVYLVEKNINSKFKDPNFYHPITFDINFNNQKYRKPINLIKACTKGKKLKIDQ